MDNVYRRTQILEIVNSEAVWTQAQLRRKLARRGVHVTQATVSRDIEELGLAKSRERSPAMTRSLSRRTMPASRRGFARNCNSSLPNESYSGFGNLAGC